VDELATRLVPWDAVEVAWARNRPHHERPALPAVGEHVWYRRNTWDPHDVCEWCQVVEVRDLDDRTDPNLWHQVRDANGQPVYDAGQPRHAPAADPWPWLRLRRPNGLIAETREARLRGSPGWLPVDYRTRPERSRLPGHTRLVARPPLPPLNIVSTTRP
jgi:hypothetical protein